MRGLQTGRHWMEEARHAHGPAELHNLLFQAHEWLTHRLHQAGVVSPGAFPLGPHIVPAMPTAAYRELLGHSSNAEQLCKDYDELKRLHQVARTLERDEREEEEGGIRP